MQECRMQCKRVLCLRVCARVYAFVCACVFVCVCVFFSVCMCTGMIALAAQRLQVAEG